MQEVIIKRIKIVGATSMRWISERVIAACRYIITIARSFIKINSIFLLNWPTVRERSVHNGTI